MKQNWSWTLPRVVGPAWWPFVLIWSVLLAISLLSSAAMLPGIIDRVAAPIKPRSAVGLRFSQNLPWPTVQNFTPAAARAGIRRGDRLVAIDGRPVAQDLNGLDRQLAGPTGSRVAVDTVTAGGRPARHLLVRDPDEFRRAVAAVHLTPAMGNLLALGLPYLFADWLILVCAIILMVRRSHDPLAPWASLMMLAVVLNYSQAESWIGPYLHVDPTVLHAVFNNTAFSLLIIVLSVFPTGRFEPRWSLAVAIGGTAVTLATGSLDTVQGNAIGLVLQGVALVPIAARYRRMPPGTGRQQIRWAILGFAASTVAMLFGTLCQFADAFTDQIGTSTCAELGAIFFFSTTLALLVVGITVSLLRYRLYDADVTISRSIVYGAVTLSLLAIFAGSEKVIEILGEQYLGERLGALAGGLGAAVAAVCIGPLHHRVSHWTEKRFRGGLLRLRTGLPTLVGNLRETVTPAMLADTMLGRVEQGVRARHGAVVVENKVVDARDIDDAEVAKWIADNGLAALPDASLRCVRSDPLFPLQVPLRSDGLGLVGWLLLGPRPDGSFYGRDERDTLEEIADPVARALATAIERQRQVAGQHERENALRRDVIALQQHVDELRAFMLDRNKPASSGVQLT